MRPAMSQPIAILVFGLLLSRPGFAELTAEEKAEVQKLVTANILLRETLADAVPLVVDHTSDATRETIGQYLQAVNGINNAYSKCIGLFLHGGLRDFPPPPGGVKYSHPPENRPQVLANAFRFLDRVQSSMDVIVDRARALVALFPQSQAAQTILAKAEEANALAQSFDDTLAYADPLPAAYPTVAGPHGDYDIAQHDLGFAFSYFYHGTSKLVRAYRAGATNLDAVALALDGLVRSYNPVQRAVAGNAGLTPFPAIQQLGLDIRALYHRNGATEGYKDACIGIARAAETARAVTPDAVELLQGALRDTADSWWGFDRWARSSTDFIH